jgi:hypothetical protein
MWNWIKNHKNAIMNVILAAAPVVAGVASGGVLTIPVAITAITGVVGKLAASPLDHSATVEDAIATATQLAKLAPPVNR